jgi:MFS transporter, DHA2 family, multidrug resistance protein
MPTIDFGSAASLARLDGEITRQALMVSYVDSFYLLFVTALVVAPLIALMRPARAQGDAPAVHMD